MKLRTSCFNKAVFRKDLTRFAPVGVLYTLCLVAGLMLMSGDKNAFPFWFANSMAVCIQYMGAINLIYGALMAALLFGDLYNSRMCNGLHSMPLRRQELFATHIVSGLTYSLVPTAVMALISVPFLNRTIVENAWQLGFYWWLGTNLQFVCCFGIAVFAALCAGNWLGMGAVYAGIQGGAMLVYFLVDCFYAPMLETVVTNGRLATLLCPVTNLTLDLIDLDSYELLRRLFYGREEEMVASFTLTDNWKNLLIWAAVGVAFLGLAWLLYRKRDLESAGDPIAVKALVPVMQVCGSLALGGIAAMVFLAMLTGSNDALGYAVLFVAIAVAWFAVRMVLQRTSRVFQKKAILALLPVLGAVAVTLGLTKLDVLGIETWIPDIDDVKSAKVSDWSGEYTQEADIRAILRLHELALQEEDIPQSGRYDKSLLAQGLSLEEVANQTYETVYTDEQIYLEDTFRYAGYVYITYDLGHGRTVQRRYLLWQDGETTAILNQLRPDWESWWANVQHNTWDGLFPMELDKLDTMYIQGIGYDRQVSYEDVMSLVEALQADYEAGHLDSTSNDPKGAFRILRTDDFTGEQSYSYDTSIYIELYNSTAEEWRTGVSLSVFPNSGNTLKWLQDRNYLAYEVVSPQ